MVSWAPPVSGQAHEAREPVPTVATARNACKAYLIPVSKFSPRFALTGLFGWRATRELT
jgi:hypothetical protein